MPPPGVKVIATNRQARRDYDVLDTVECGIVLQGSEVKSLREAHVQFADANGWIRDGEAWLLGLHIAPYSHAAGVNGHNPDRERKLLLRRDEILRLKSRVDQERLALIPLCGCGGPPATPPSQVVEDPAIGEAKSKDSGEGLKPGETREVKTSHGIVVVYKNANDQIAYRKK